MNKFNFFNYWKALKHIESLENFCDRQSKDIDFLNSEIPDYQDICLTDVAQELLEALEDAFKAWSDPDHIPQPEEWFAAIKKAKGES